MRRSSLRLQSSPGTRDAAGVWTAEQARRLVAYTQIGGRAHRCGRVHERADARRHGRGPGGLRGGRLRPRLQPLQGICTAGCARPADPRSGLRRRNRRPPRTSATAPRASCVRATCWRPPGPASMRSPTTTMGQSPNAVPPSAGRRAPAEALSEQWLARTDLTLAFYRQLARRLRARQAALAHRDRRRGLRRQPLGAHLPRHVPVSRPARTPGEAGGGGCRAQHARRKRLRPAGRQDARAEAKLLGRAAVEDG